VRTPLEQAEKLGWRNTDETVEVSWPPKTGQVAKRESRP
jgi:hypothetical protein